jgi:ATP-dependent protease Clp ATPase subunit
LEGHGTAVSAEAGEHPDQQRSALSFEWILSIMEGVMRTLDRSLEKRIIVRCVEIMFASCRVALSKARLQ